jgi:MFS transporter, DHA2 family, multidrug resistance protein
MPDQESENACGILVVATGSRPQETRAADSRMSTANDALHNAEDEQHDWKPAANPWLIALSVMLATFMTSLNASVANVALPYIAGDLSATTDESTWVLTSYLVANAIMLPASSWLARRIGRKRLIIISILIFTAASLLCGMALNMPMLIAARILQGIGGCMQPLAQAILLESFPLELQGTAMAVYGTGIVVAPVIGPTLGGWITDSFSWHWIFYVNIPVGLLALVMVNLYVEDPPYLRHAFHGAIDYFGFGMMTIWLGALQLVLDKGQEADWFAASWVCWTAAISALAFLGFILREFMIREPIVQLRILANRNFLVGTVITCLYGVILFGVTAELPLFLQTQMGYSAMQSGLAVSPRGLGTMISMMLVGVLVNYIDARILLGCGFAIFGYSSILLSHINFSISFGSVAWPNFMNGFAGGFVFVPLTTMSMGLLRKAEIGNAAGIYNLMRNIGGSVGIALVTTFLVRGTQVHQNYLGADISAGNPIATTMMHNLETKFTAEGASLANAHHQAMGFLYQSIQHQSSLLAYADNFSLLGYLALLCVPLAMFFQQVKKH